MKNSKTRNAWVWMTWKRDRANALISFDAAIGALNQEKFGRGTREHEMDLSTRLIGGEVLETPYRTFQMASAF